MGEDVLILLNEREPLKQQMAASLAEELESRRFTHHRLKPTPNLAEIVFERAPRVAVLDFLLGDEGTALDLLSYLNTLDRDRKTQCILWTDERSISVAVNAMKLGAQDYIELGNPKDIEKVIRSIESILISPVEPAPGKSQKSSKPSHQLSEPIGQAPASRQSIGTAVAAIRTSPRVLFFLGGPGSGRSLLAKYIHPLRQAAGAFIEIEVEKWTGDAADIFGGPKFHTQAHALSAGATVLIEHVEFDTAGELLNAFVEQKKQIWEDEAQSGDPLLIVGSPSKEQAEAWQKFAQAKIIELPDLAARKEDLLPLLHRFQMEARQLGTVNKLELDSEIIETISSWNWPGNIKQLKACFLEISLAPPPLLSAALGIGEAGNFDQAFALKALAHVKEIYERSVLFDPKPPSALRARAELDRACGNLRLAASALGVGVPQIKAALSGQYHSATSPTKTGDTVR